MCVIVPTRSVYLFGIRMSYQKGCAIGTPGWLNVVSAVPKPLLCNHSECLTQAPHIPKTLIPGCLLKHSRIEMKLTLCLREEDNPDKRCIQEYSLFSFPQ